MSLWAKLDGSLWALVQPLPFCPQRRSKTAGLLDMAWFMSSLLVWIGASGFVLLSGAMAWECLIEYLTGDWPLYRGRPSNFGYFCNAGSLLCQMFLVALAVTGWKIAIHFEQAACAAEWRHHFWMHGQEPSPRLQAIYEEIEFLITAREEQQKVRDFYLRHDRPARAYPPQFPGGMVLWPGG